MIYERNVNGIERNVLFRGVPSSFIRKILDFRSFIDLKEGEIIFCRDEVPEFIYLNCGGDVRIKFSQKGIKNQKVIYDFFGSEEVIDECNRISSAVAYTNTLLYKISANQLNKFCKQYPVILENIKNADQCIVDKKVEDEFINLDLSDIVGHISTQISFDESFETEDESFTQLSENELDSILEKQNVHRQFKSEMRRVGKVKNDSIFDGMDLNEGKFDDLSLTGTD